MAERILIVDDDDHLTRAYKEYFAAEGHEVDCAHELEEAQTLLAHCPYSVVITDLRLTRLGFGGLDLVKYIRELALNTRVIVLTGYSWPEVMAEVCEQEVDAFVRKPKRLSEMARIVGKFVRGNA